MGRCFREFGVRVQLDEGIVVQGMASGEQSAKSIGGNEGDPTGMLVVEIGEMNR